MFYALKIGLHISCIPFAPTVPLLEYPWKFFIDFAERKITPSQLHDHGLSWKAALVGTMPSWKPRPSMGPIAVSETQIINDQVSFYI